MSNISWRVLMNEPASGEWNMAVDEALMHYVRATEHAVLRVYGWSSPTLSFGRNQAAVGKYDAARLRTAGVSCVRRPTGGRAVLHYREVTYSVVAAGSGLGSLRDSYERINTLLLNALDLLGVAATAATAAPGVSAASGASAPGASGASGASFGLTSDPQHAHGPTPCFDTPSKGEVVLDGKKLVGSAQWRDGDVLLQHGSILVRDDQSQIAELLVQQPLEHRGEARSAPATLSVAMGREPSFTDVAEALHSALLELEDPHASPISTADLPADELALAHARYADASWTWRR